MKQASKLICVVLVIFIGCTENEMLNSPNIDYVFPPEIRCEDIIRGFEDVEKDMSLYVIFMDDKGLVEEGVEVNLLLDGVEGSISPAEAVTDENGRIEAVLIVKVSLGVSIALITAKTVDCTGFKQIEITGIKRPATMQFTADMYVINTFPGENREIGLHALLLNAHGATCPNIDMKFSLHPTDPDSEIFGSIDQITPTTAVFNTMGGGGKVKIVCEVEELIGTEYALSDSIQLTIELLTSGPIQFSLAINPCYLLLPKDTVGHATIYARKMDGNMNGIPNLQIDFNCQYGSIRTQRLQIVQDLLQRIIIFCLLPIFPTVQMRLKM
ncbi:MAG: hypothetical protein HQ568_06550 [Calditrichaeota bacterium]|nr:hypothetical protein [Calditrichota bacterium]